MKKGILIAGLVLVASLGYWFLGRGDAETDGSYLFVPLEQGDIESVVSSTGTLEPVTSVQVGTQVSGIIDEIHADFNDHVTAGQVIARVDTTLLVSAVRDAEAGLERSEAELRHADLEFNRITDLYGNELVAESDMNTAQYDLDVARASVKSSRNSLERARKNLGYAIVRAPISGTVIERNVDVGQTVQSSFSAPQLFLIAADLSHMQILVAVDESDIGMITEGQEARFTVQAYPERVFTGTVRQVRLQSVTQENVVNYTVVVDVANPDGVLLPGMTATVDFVVETAKDVLRVANGALRFRPTDEMRAALAAQREKRRAGAGGGDEGGAEAGGRGSNGGMGAHATGGDGATGGGNRRPTLLWYLDDQGRATATPVKTGITDGISTEVSGPGLAAGMQIIAGITHGAPKSEGPSSPFQQNQPTGGRPRPGGF